MESIPRTARTLVVAACAFGSAACGPSIDPDAVDPCADLAGVELKMINNFESGNTSPWSWTWGDGSVGAVEDLSAREVPETAPDCPSAPNVTGGMAAVFTMTDNNLYGGGAGGGALGAAQENDGQVTDGPATGFKGVAMWAMAEGDSGVRLSMSTWQTNRSLQVPAEVELVEGSNAIAIGKDRELAVCAKGWGDTNEDGVANEGDSGDDITGDGIPDEIPVAWRCGDDFSTEILFPHRWSLVKIPFTSLRQEGSGRVWDSLDPRSIGGLGWRFPGGDTTIWIDYVGFYR